MKHEALKIVFFGSLEKFSEMYLWALKNAGFEIVLEVKNKSTDFDSIEKRLAGRELDLGIIAYFGKIVPKKILEIPKYGFFNVHPSLLPRWRGPSPVQAAILAGDKITGVTIHLATAQFDAGDILMQKEVVILENDTCLSLTGRLAKEGAALLPTTIEKWLSGEIKPQKQDHNKATYTKIIKKQDGEIDWTRSADYIERMTRAYDPWPGTFTTIQNSKSKTQFKILKIKKVEVIENAGNLAPGEFFEVDGLPAVACGKKALKLLIVHPEGKKEMSGDAFLRGHREILS